MKAVLSKFHRCRAGTTPMRTLDCGKVQVMKGIKDIILKGSIFAVLTAVFCVGAFFHTPFTYTALAATEITSDKTNWSGEMILTGDDDVTVSGHAHSKHHSDSCRGQETDIEWRD